MKISCLLRHFTGVQCVALPLLSEDHCSRTKAKALWMCHFTTFLLLTLWEHKQLDQYSNYHNTQVFCLSFVSNQDWYSFMAASSSAALSWCNQEATATYHLDSSPSWWHMSLTDSQQITICPQMFLGQPMEVCPCFVGENCSRGMK